MIEKEQVDEFLPCKLSEKELHTQERFNHRA